VGLEKIAGGETVNVVYAGRRLVLRQKCFWKVCVWDKDGRARWSEPASWTMGLLNASDWSGNYISFRDTTPVHKDPKTLFPPARQYRKDFTGRQQ
jgi:alpha-L-rhamnosidase